MCLRIKDINVFCMLPIRAGQQIKIRELQCVERRLLPTIGQRLHGKKQQHNLPVSDIVENFLSLFLDGAGSFEASHPK